MFHGVIQKITLAQFFLRHGVEQHCMYMYCSGRKAAAHVTQHEQTRCHKITHNRNKLQRSQHSTGLTYKQHAQCLVTKQCLILTCTEHKLMHVEKLTDLQTLREWVLELQTQL